VVKRFRAFVVVVVFAFFFFFFFFFSSLVFFSLFFFSNPLGERERESKIEFFNTNLLLAVSSLSKKRA